MNAEMKTFLIQFLEITTSLFIFSIGFVALVLIWVYVADRNQTQHAIRRNYPIVGRFRYWFEHMGEFFRQYFFAMDREEMPFNRAQRSWVYRAAKNIDNTIAFGSSQNVRKPGSILFVNSMFPVLKEDSVEQEKMVFGPGTENPYKTSSVFNISGMSYGAISKPAILSLSMGAKQAGCWMNTGEGGLSPFHLEGGADIIFQIGTAKYGVRDESGELSEEKLREVASHDQVKMFEIKLSQGAKPGKGGILPGEKVTAEIAAIRGIPKGEDSISPNRHTDIYSIDSLLDMIARVRKITGKPTGMKCVIGSFAWLETMCENIHRRGIESAPDFITVDSGDGGTGAAPMSLMDDVGLTIKESLPVVVNTLQKHGLLPRIRIVASGKLVTPSEVAWALCVGADAVVSARGFMFSLGCIQALQCNKNTCPTGIATHKKKFQRGLVPADKAQRVKSYQENMIHELEVIAQACGVTKPRLLTREHARVVTEQGNSMPLDEAYPEVMPIKLVAS